MPSDTLAMQRSRQFSSVGDRRVKLWFHLVGDGPLTTIRLTGDTDAGYCSVRHIHMYNKIKAVSLAVPLEECPYPMRDDVDNETLRPFPSSTTDCPTRIHDNFELCGTANRKYTRI